MGILSTLKTSVSNAAQKITNSASQANKKISSVSKSVKSVSTTANKSISSVSKSVNKTTSNVSNSISAAQRAAQQAAEQAATRAKAEAQARAAQIKAAEQAAAQAAAQRAAQIRAAEEAAKRAAQQAAAQAKARAEAAAKAAQQAAAQRAAQIKAAEQAAARAAADARARAEAAARAAAQAAQAKAQAAAKAAQQAAAQRAAQIKAAEQAAARAAQEAKARAEAAARAAAQAATQRAAQAKAQAEAAAKAAQQAAQAKAQAAARAAQEAAAQAQARALTAQRAAEQAAAKKAADIKAQAEAAARAAQEAAAQARAQALTVQRAAEQKALTVKNQSISKTFNSIKEAANTLNKKTTVITGAQSASFAPNLSNLKNNVSTIAGKGQNIAGSVSKSIDTVMDARAKSYEQAGQKIGQGKLAAGGGQLVTTTAADVILPLDLVNVGNKIATGRLKEVSKEDAFWAAVDLVGLIPTPVTVLGGRALKTMKGEAKAGKAVIGGAEAILTVSKLGKVEKGLKAAEGIKIASNSFEAAKTAQRGIEAAEITGKTIAGGGETFKTAGFLEGLKKGSEIAGSFKTAQKGEIKTLKAAESGSGFTSLIPIKYNLTLKGANSATGSKGVKTLVKSFNYPTAQKIVKSAQSLEAAKPTGKAVNSISGIKSLSKTSKLTGAGAGAAITQATLKSDLAKQALKAMDDLENLKIAKKLEETKKLEAFESAKSTFKASQIANKTKALEEFKQAQKAAGLKISAGLEDIEQAGSKISKVIPESILKTVKVSDEAKSIEKAGLTASSKLFDELEEGAQAIKKAANSTEAKLTSPAVNTLKGMTKADIGKTFESVDIGKGFESVSTAKPLDSVKVAGNMEAVKSTKTGGLFGNLKSKSKYILAGLGGAGLYSMLKLDESGGFMDNGLIDDVGGLLPGGTGAGLLPEGYTQNPDGSYTAPDGTTIFPDGSILGPDGVLTLPDGSQIDPDSPGYEEALEELGYDTGSLPGYADGTGSGSYQDDSYTKALEDYVKELEGMIGGGDAAYYDDLTGLKDQYENGEISEEEYQDGLKDIADDLEDQYESGNISEEDYQNYSDAIDGLYSGDTSSYDSLEPSLFSRAIGWLFSHWKAILLVLIVYYVISRRKKIGRAVRGRS